MSHTVQAQCNLLNQLQPGLEVVLKKDWFAAMTYGSNFRTGPSGEDPVVTVKKLPDAIYIQPEMPGHKLWLNLWHGRKDPKQEMDGWGFNHQETEGYTGAPTGDAMVFTKEGVKLITFHTDGKWVEVLVPFVGDMMFYEGNYYGDYSADNDGRTA